MFHSKAFLLAKHYSREVNGRLYRNTRKVSRRNLRCIETQQLMDLFPIIVDDLINDPQHGDAPEVANSIKNMLEYIVPTGGKVRALSLVRSYRSMEDPENLTPENMKLAYILGWCTELLQGACNAVDDMIDNSETRRGIGCWYKNKDVGARINAQAILVENYPYMLLEKYFSHLPIYVPAMQFVRDTTLQLTIGGIIDAMPLDSTKGLTIDRFTRKRYQNLARCKTTSLAVELPYNLARCLSNKLHIEIPLQTREMLIKLGEFYQIQNDFLDCYDDRSTSFKTGNDIEEGRCSWLVVTALEKANSEQRQLLETHYGRKDPESVEIVKKLYDVLNVVTTYAIYEENIFDLIETNIDAVSKLICHEIMFKRLDYLYEKYI